MANYCRLGRYLVVGSNPYPPFHARIAYLNWLYITPVLFHKIVNRQPLRREIEEGWEKVPLALKAGHKERPQRSGQWGLIVISAEPQQGPAWGRGSLS